MSNSNPSGQPELSPLARACQVKVSWTPNVAEANQDPRPKLAVVSTQLGWLHAQRGQWSYIVLKRFGTTKSGWVPTSKVEWGSTPVVPMPVQLPSTRPPPTPMPAPSPNENVLQQTLKAIWGTIRNNRDIVVREGDRGNVGIASTLFGPGVDRYPYLMYRCMTPQAVEIMKDGTFNPRDLVSRVAPIGEAHDPKLVFGIYLYIFRDIDHGITKMMDVPYPRDALYVGQSLDLRNRESRHRSRLEIPRANENSNLYKVGITAQRHAMIPLIIFRHEDTEIAHFGRSLMLNVAELTAVCLFQSWFPILTRGSIPSSAGAILIDYEYARIFSVLMDKVRKQTGWTPNPTIGLNWQTPAVTRMDSEREWVSWYNWERAAYIYRSRRKVFVFDKSGTNKGDSTAINWRSGHYVIHIPVRVQQEAQFKNGDPVTVQVELKHDGEKYLDHPVPWVRVCRPCHNVEFEKLRSLSVQVQWVDKRTQQWKSAALQWTHSRDRSQEEFSMLIQGMILLSTLTQTTYRNAPSWCVPLDRTVIRHMKVDFLRQQAFVAPLPTGGRVRDWPQNSTVEFNEHRLKTAIPSSLANDVYFGAKPQQGLGRARKDCDLCLSFLDTAPCNYDEESGTCPLCVSLHRPCTWTAWVQGRNVSELVKTGGALQDLGWPTHLQSTQDKFARKFKRPMETFILELDEEPFSVGIEKQIQDECEEDQNP